VTKNGRGWRLWERYGVEQEYMIVDRKTLDVRPRADVLLRDGAGNVVSEWVKGTVGYSNELVSHVIELKSAEPLRSLVGWSTRIADEIREIDGILAEKGLRLLPTAAHPWMNPLAETVLWPHESTDIYQTYDRIFNCQGHGWANLQSTHLNLSFHGDDDFARLHAAVRAVLPLIPALSAASPYLDGRYAGYVDARLETYRHNQERVPVIAGEVIPEAVYSHAAYEKQIFARIRDSIAPYDPAGILDQHFLNSRGAIARFDRGSIEIRIIDLQECPAADLAILQMVVALLKLLCEERWISMAELQSLDTLRLRELLFRGIALGESARCEDARFMRAFGIAGTSIPFGEIWKRLWPELRGSVEPVLQNVAEQMLERGCLAGRLLAKLGRTPSHEQLRIVYGDLADCLVENRLWNDPLF